MNLKFLRTLVLSCCVVLFVTMFAPVASAHTFSTDGLYTPFQEPILKNYTWSPIEKVTGIAQESKYFVIKTTSGGFEEELYISLPAEGGFRLQSKHEYQKAVEVSNVGLFEPSSIAVIDYKTDSEGAVIMKGADGTVVRYLPDGNGFVLEVLNAGGSRIIYITNEQISLAHKKDGTVVRTMVEMPVEPEKEAIYNGSNRFTGPNVVGEHFSLTNKDCYSNPDYSYGNIALFHSNRGYSVWFNMTYPGEADFGHADPEKYTITFDGDKLDFYLWTGTPLENLKKYTDLTGTSGVTEEWTFGFWAGAASQAYTTTEQMNAYANIQTLVEGFKENWNFYPEALYGESAGMTAQALTYTKQRGIRMLGWMRPYNTVDELTALLPGYNATPIKNADGSFASTGFPFVYNDLTLKESGLYVFTQAGWMDTSNPSFKDVLTAKFQKLWEGGLSGMMIDMGENLTYKGTCWNGLSANEMHNLNSYYYAKHANEAWSEYHGNDYALFLRSSSAGSQYWSANFQGDQTADYDGYSSVISDMISRGAGGFNLYGSDMGGFSSHPTKDLWNRWVVLSTFSPYMRSHGVVIHMPWKYGDAAIENFGDYYYLRKNLVPSIMSAAIDANKTSNPMVKGMMMAYPYYLSLKDVDNQYLFCDDFLVCAVETADQHCLEVSLPQGNSWYNLFTHEMLKGGQKLTVEAPSNFMPVFVKDGAVKAINLPDSMQLMAEMHDEEDTEFSEHESLLITPPNAKRETVIYTKEGESEDFRTYKSTTETYVSTPKDTATFTVSNAAGSRRQIILALGVTAADVTVDGEKLTRLEYTPDYYNEEYGYHVDLSGMTTIYVPAGWKELTVTKGKGGYVAHAASEDNEAGMHRMFDGDVATVYALSPGESKWQMYLKDDAVQTIGRIEVKWAAGFLQSYDIEYSADGGATWELLLPEGEEEHTVSAGGGGIDILEFTPVKANCLRIVKAKMGDVTAQLGIYELNVFAPDEFQALIPGGDDNPDEFYDEDEFWPDDWDDTDDDGKKGGYTTIKRKKTIYPGFPVWGIVLIVGGCVIVATGILLLILFLLRKKKKKQAEEALKAEEAEISDLPLQE